MDKTVEELTNDVIEQLQNSGKVLIKNLNESLTRHNIFYYGTAFGGYKIEIFTMTNTVVEVKVTFIPTNENRGFIINKNLDTFEDDIEYFKILERIVKNIKETSKQLLFEISYTDYFIKNTIYKI